MKWLIVAGLLLSLAGCGGGDGGATQEAAPPSVNATGVWNGVIPSVNQANSQVPETSSSSVSITLNQSGASLSGNYFASTGAFGDIAGTISGNNIDVTIALTRESCSGTLTGTGVINKPVTGHATMEFHVSGFSTCGGNEDDIAYLTQVAVPPLSHP
ncbi:hypothetical protein [Geomonas edaphica]|uniref:hypothetical protein n=1 Tax=Geomonas edaphica TaxID=2570226 RepID=UPI0010A897D0|nr:hypothetical protein [Geomonas edaphica]